MHRTTLEARRHVRGEDHGRARADPPLMYSVRRLVRARSTQ